MNQIDEAIKITNTNQISLEALGQMVAAVVECFNIQQILDRCEETDKKTFGLYGIKESVGDTTPRHKSVFEEEKEKQDLNLKEKNISLPNIARNNRNQSMTPSIKKKGKNDINIKVDKKCLSCSGQSSMVLSAFKLACLN